MGSESEYKGRNEKARVLVNCSGVGVVLERRRKRGVRVIDNDCC